MKRVVILQEYVPQYRVPFFELLRKKALERDIDVIVAAGAANVVQAERGDAGALTFGLPLKQVEKRILGRRIVIRSVRRAIEGADLVILEHARRNLDAYRMLAFKRTKGPVIALWGHGKDFTNATTGFERTLSRWLASRAGWFFAYTNGGKNHLISEGFHGDKVTVVQNSIDSHALRTAVDAVSDIERHDFRSRYDLRGKTALFIGALDESKRLSFLFEAAMDVHNQDSDFRLLVAGDGALREQVEGWATDHSWIKYLGSLRGREKATAFTVADVLSMPGRVGLVAVDSFAAGVPIVTTNWPWHAPEFEYLDDGRTAVITDDEPVSYANSLSSLLHSPEILAELRHAARAANEVYSLEVMVNNFIDGICYALASEK